MKTPNCALCQWRDVIVDKFFGSKEYKCSAQARQRCEHVYNSKQCKELYKNKEEK